MSKYYNNINENFGHIGFVVNDIEKEIIKWSKSSEVIIKPKLDPIQNVLCALVIYNSIIPIELISPNKNNKKHPLTSRLKKGGGMDHICLYCDDIENEIAYKIKNDAILINGPIYGEVFDRMIAFLYTKEGFILELMEKKAIGKSKRDPLELIHKNFK